MAIPFRVAVIGDAFTDRDVEVRAVLESMRVGGRLIVFGERRLGKTAIVQRAAGRLRSEGGVAIYLDFWAAANEGAVLRRILDQAPTKWFSGTKLSRTMKSLAGMVRLSMDAGGAPVLSLDPGFIETSPGRFDRTVRKLNEIAERTAEPVVLIIDEFQKGEDRVGISPAGLRSLAQDCPRLGFVFSGSAMGTISAMMDADGPFYGYPTLEVHPIDRAHLATWVGSVLEQHDRRIAHAESLAIVDTCSGITSYVLELANQVWARTPEDHEIHRDDVARAFDEEAEARTGQYDLLWDQLNSTQRLVMVAAAWEVEYLTTEATRRRFGLPAPSTVISSAQTLKADGYLRPLEGARIADPFFAQWVRRRTPQP